jgi:hypothetical protein
MRFVVVLFAIASRRALGAGVLALLMVLTGGGVPVANAVADVQTWVSGVGDDANPCSRTAPCLTWSGALAKTAPGGEIDALDAGDFGAVTINSAVTLDGSGVLAVTHGIVVALTDGRPDGFVIIRHVSIQGDGNAPSGIRVTSATGVQVEGSAISGFATHGVDFEPSPGSGPLVVNNCQIHDNGDSGVFVNTPAGGVMHATINDTELSNNAFGINARGYANVMVRNSTISNNTSVGLQMQGGGSGLPQLAAVNVKASLNATGVLVQNGGVIRMTNMSVFDNTVGFTVLNGGSVISIGANRIAGNGSGNQPTIVVIPEQ